MPNGCKNGYRSSSERETVQVHYVYWSSSEQDWKWSLNIPYSLANGIASDSHQMASQETVTKWNQERQWRQLPRDDHWDFAATKITVEGLQIGIEWEDYWEPSTDGPDWDVYQTAYRNECRTPILEAYKPAWPMLKEDENNYWRAPCESHRLQERMSDIEAGLQSYARGSGEHKHACIYMVWLTISWEAYKIGTRSYMIDHYRRQWYREQKLQSMPRTSKAATMITDGLGLQSSRGIGRARMLAHLKV